MSRFMSITLERRGISCVAQLLEKDAPLTCDAVWSNLPHAGPVHHAKYARNEIYTMVERFIDQPIGLEKLPGVIDLAIFYGRNNILLNGDVGWVPGNVYATIVEGLDAMAEACNDVWRSGSVGERL